jgi:hypothetical protein
VTRGGIRILVQLPTIHPRVQPTGADVGDKGCREWGVDRSAPHSPNTRLAHECHPWDVPPLPHPHPPPLIAIPTIRRHVENKPQRGLFVRAAGSAMPMSSPTCFQRTRMKLPKPLPFSPLSGCQQGQTPHAAIILTEEPSPPSHPSHKRKPTHTLKRTHAHLVTTGQGR